MAQEIAISHPEAIALDALGYYTVDYSKLGIDFVTYDTWKASRAAEVTLKV